MNSGDYVTVARVRVALLALYRSDPEINAKQTLQRAFQDDVLPKDSRGRWRVNRIVLTLLLAATASVAVFLYFCIR